MREFLGLGTRLEIPLKILFDLMIDVQLLRSIHGSLVLRVITRRGHGVFPSTLKPPKKPNWRKRLISDKIDQITTRLTIVKVKREDAGRVVCRARNGVGGETTTSVKTTYLKVNRK